MKRTVELPKVYPVAASPQHSETTNSIDLADGVVVRNAVKSYGVGKRRSTVLNGLEMTVKKGAM